MCVNVLLLGPITADMLVREGLCWGGVVVKPPGPLGSSQRRDGENITGFTASLMDGTGREGAYVCRVVFRYVL